MLRTTGLLLVLLGALAACRAGGDSAPGLTASGSTSPSVLASPVGTRPELPAGFPVLPGVTEVALPPDDLGVIARWATDKVGTIAFDFYSDALPAAGYAVEGLYPGGQWALVRFTGPTGQLWQVMIHGLDLHTAQIEVRLDRP
jgi:hypothetical protein